MATNQKIKKIGILRGMETTFPDGLIPHINETYGDQGIHAEYIKLDELGDPAFNGTTHMLMTGTNHLEVADVILGWVDEYVVAENQ